MLWDNLLYFFYCYYVVGSDVIDILNLEGKGPSVICSVVYTISSQQLRFFAEILGIGRPTKYFTCCPAT